MVAEMIIESRLDTLSRLGRVPALAAGLASYAWECRHQQDRPAVRALGQAAIQCQLLNDMVSDTLLEPLGRGHNCPAAVFTPASLPAFRDEVLRVHDRLYGDYRTRLRHLLDSLDALAAALRDAG